MRSEEHLELYHNFFRKGKGVKMGTATLIGVIVCMANMLLAGFLLGHALAKLTASKSDRPARLVIVEVVKVGRLTRRARPAKPTPECGAEGVEVDDNLDKATDDADDGCDNV